MTAEPDREMESDATHWHPVLRTTRDEIAETIRDPRHSQALEPAHAEELARWIADAPETLIAQVAVRAGQFIIEGFDYWDALVLTSERILGL